MTAAPMEGPITMGISTKNTIRSPWTAPTRSVGVWSRTVAFTVADTRSWIGTTLLELGRLAEGREEFVKAVAVMRPSHSVRDLEQKSVMKKFKTPSFAAGSITGEKERKTYEMLLASPMRPGAIVTGKLFAAIRREAQRCRDCEFPTCSSACPAGVDVPAYSTAIAEGFFC